MKNITLIFTIIISGILSAQDNYFRGREITEAGKFSVGLNSSGLSYDSTSKIKNINVDINAGYFIIDQFQIKAGVSADIKITDENSVIINYSVGAKYYINNMFPVYIGYYGANGYNLKRIKSNLDIKAGYAYFISNYLSLEPSIGYLYSNSKANRFNFNLGINLFF